MKQVIEDVGVALRPLLAARKCGLDVQAGTSPMFVRGGADIKQIYMSLLVNSVQAQATLIQITAELAVATPSDHGRDGSVWRFVIRDNGCGISEAMRDILFKPFATTKSDAAGLGLHVARQLARLNGGELALQDSRPGATAFVLELPVVPRAESDSDRHDA